MDRILAQIVPYFSAHQMNIYSYNKINKRGVSHERNDHIFTRFDLRKLCREN